MNKTLLPHSVSLPPAFPFLSLLVFFLCFRLKNREGATGCADTNQELSTDGNSNMTLIVSPGKQVSPSVGGADNVASKSVAVWQKNSEEVIQNYGKILEAPVCRTCSGNFHQLVEVSTEIYLSSF